ncbi:IS30 family transposase [Arthrobacter sp. RIT-PI-e]|uniref:IS30 family transposase n=1 Tax=Arthrobacter sp. RIT-PI-e TaxID=1681197 RepID=UPI0009E21D49|nr:IS30 family transposase [Arthrobacter sp. RIT-PI-e]
MGGNQASRDRHDRFWQLLRQGYTAGAACEAVKVHRSQGYRWIKAAGGRFPVGERPQSGRYLSQDDRLKIADLRLAGAGVRRIAKELGRAPSTISRELHRNSRQNSGAYRPYAAQKRCDLRALRPKPGKLTDPRLVAVVEERLRKNWSPQQISDDLKRVFAGRREMQVSHETIYQSLFVQGRGHLRADLHRHLRTGRAVRQPRGLHFTSKGRIRDKIMISERPAEASDRAVPGHWEGDLIVGSASGSAIGTLVERTTRYLMLVHLPDGHSAENVRDGLVATISTLPAHLRRSLTWDQGTEMARHREVTLATDMAIFFCDPHSPWQRGSNENTNGLLRQYFPKGTNLNAHSAEHLLEVATELNQRPRKTLSGITPAASLEKLLLNSPEPSVATTL